MDKVENTFAKSKHQLEALFCHHFPQRTSHCQGNGWMESELQRCRQTELELSMAAQIQEFSIYFVTLLTMSLNKLFTKRCLTCGEIPGNLIKMAAVMNEQ
jgi:hypothetical protein